MAQNVSAASAAHAAVSCRSLSSHNRPPSPLCAFCSRLLTLIRLNAHQRLRMTGRPSTPAWGGGAGSRAAPGAAARKLMTVKDLKQRAERPGGFAVDSAPSTAHSSSSAGW